jgi:aspartyl-tRNA(Asn)/glutamyl-tRNA(Gln) amidotransferase subunit A
MNKEIFSYIDSPPQSPQRVKGVLSGKTVAIQPNMSVRGWPAEAGSKALEGYVALKDATVVERLKNEGAIIKASTRMSELGFGLIGDTSYRAVREGEVDVVLVTDTMGEARVTACLGSVLGFKPSYGIVSRFGLIGFVPSMECYGVVAKTPQEVISVMKAIAGYDENDFSMPECDLPDFSCVGRKKFSGKVGVIKECMQKLEPLERKPFDKAMLKLAKIGVSVEEVSLKDYDLFRTVHNVVASVEASSGAGKYDGVRYGHRNSLAKNWNEMYLKSRAESFGELIKTYLFQGAYFQFKNYPAFENACRIRGRLIQETKSLFKKVNLLALPTRRKSANFKGIDTISAVYDLFSLTLIANVTGSPSVHIPGFLCDGDIDLGLQLVGPALSDAEILSLSCQVQSDVRGK